MIFCNVFSFFLHAYVSSLPPCNLIFSPFLSHVYKSLGFLFCFSFSFFFLQLQYQNPLYSTIFFLHLKLDFFNLEKQPQPPLLYQLSPPFILFFSSLFCHSKWCRVSDGLRLILIVDQFLNFWSLSLFFFFWFVFCFWSVDFVTSVCWIRKCQVLKLGERESCC